MIRYCEIDFNKVTCGKNILRLPLLSSTKPNLMLEASIHQEVYYYNYNYFLINFYINNNI